MMKKMLLLLMFLALFYVAVAIAAEKPPTLNPAQEQRADKPGRLAVDNATIGPSGVAMPVRKIILAKKGLEYCSIKFTSTWLEEKKHDYYTAYECHYQGDGSGDFNKSNVKFGNGELFYPRERGWFVIPFTSEAKDTFECGRMKIKWFYASGVSFDDLELAPTPWTSITDVNVHDTRLQWFRKDAKRKKIKVPIDQF
jgi:hypothetical protein